MALHTLELWFDSLNPEFLEAAMAEVVQELMGALWALLTPTSQLRFKVLTVLGKLGGRNRRFLQHQQPRLEYRSNPEHGLRLILTFRPNTSFLVPLDKCVALARAGLFADSLATPPADGDDTYYRLQVRWAAGGGWGEVAARCAGRAVCWASGVLGERCGAQGGAGRNRRVRCGEAQCGATCATCAAATLGGRVRLLRVVRYVAGRCVRGVYLTLLAAAAPSCTSGTQVSARVPGKPAQPAAGFRRRRWAAADCPCRAGSRRRGHRRRGRCRRGGRAGVCSRRRGQCQRARRCRGRSRRQDAGNAHGKERDAAAQRDCALQDGHGRQDKDAACGGAAGAMRMRPRVPWGALCGQGGWSDGPARATLSRRRPWRHCVKATSFRPQNGDSYPPF
eukprot:353874-Chlamydomonas_euryale.AAC.2